MTKEELYETAVSLPVEERALLVDTLLRSLTPHDSAIEREWAGVAAVRMEEISSGKVTTIPGEEVAAEIKRRFRS